MQKATPQKAKKEPCTRVFALKRGAEYAFEIYFGESKWGKLWIDHSLISKDKL